MIDRLAGMIGMPYLYFIFYFLHSAEGKEVEEEEGKEKQKVFFFLVEEGGHYMQQMRH